MSAEPSARSSHGDDVELNWLAQQYVLGELSEAELAQFEARLERCSVAQDALVSATRLIATLGPVCLTSPSTTLADSLTRPMPACPISRRASPVRAWWGFGALAAACLLAFIAADGWLQSGRDSSPIAASSVQPASEGNFLAAIELIDGWLQINEIEQLERFEQSRSHNGSSVDQGASAPVAELTTGEAAPKVEPQVVLPDDPATSDLEEFASVDDAEDPDVEGSDPAFPSWLVAAVEMVPTTP